jgi:hypothetical protein
MESDINKEDNLYGNDYNSKREINPSLSVILGIQLGKSFIIEGYYKLNISYGKFKGTLIEEKPSTEPNIYTYKDKTYNMDLPHYWGIILKLRF